MKSLILLFFLFPIICFSQNRHYTPIGFDIEDQAILIVVDTINNNCQLRMYMRGKYYCNVYDKTIIYKYFNQDVRLYFGRCITFPYQHGNSLVIWNKKFIKNPNHRKAIHVTYKI